MAYRIQRVCPIYTSGSDAHDVSCGFRVLSFLSRKELSPSVSYDAWGNFFALSRSRCLRAGSVRARYIFMDAIVHRRKRSHVAIWIQNGRQHRQKLNVCSPAPTPVQPPIRFRSAAFCFRFPKRFRLALFRMPFRSMPFFARGGLRAQEGHRVQSSGGREGGR